MEGQHWVFVLIFLMTISSIKAMGKSQYTALYVFGDSVSDPGNNKNFSVKFLPNGIDYPKGPTGRCANGKLIADLLGERLGFPYIPSYTDTIEKGDDILSGVNYAQAGAGILNETGRLFGIISLSGQIELFKSTLNQLEKQMQKDEMSNYLGKGLVFVTIAINDYFNNYLFTSLYNSSKIYNPHQFTDLIINHYKHYIMELHGLGMRKFFLADMIPVGCMPNGLKLGKCDSYSNHLVQMFNSRLKSLVRRLNSDNPGSTFVVGASYRIFNDIRDHADTYGFKVMDRGCCSTGVKDAAATFCLPKSVVCDNKDEYLFWDLFHLTEAADRIFAQRYYNGTSKSCFPMNIQKMGQM